MDDAPYYRRDLALVHHRSFGHHAELCAAGILALLAPLRGRPVLELGCGSGLLTRHLVDAGHLVIATDASPAMLDLAAQEVPDAAEIRRLTLPDDPLPTVDAVVSVGHALNYLPDVSSIERSLIAICQALRPAGVLAIDLCDLRWGEVRRDGPDVCLVEEDWAMVSRFSTPAPDRFVRAITTFVRQDDGSWRRDDERHDNVLVDTATIPELLAAHGVSADVRASFGDESLPEGLVTIVGARAP